MYFSRFPIVPYRFGENSTATAFVNLSTFSNALTNIRENALFYNLYQVSNGDRPDIVSRKLYGTPEYYWTFFLLNDALKDNGWMLSEQELKLKMETDYPGVCLVVFGKAVGDDTNFEQHTLVNKFPIGSEVTGLISGATGTVYARNVNLGQLFVDVESGTFQAGETIVDNSSGTPLYACNVGIVHSPAYLATHHFEDGDGTHIDVDYSADFRGRAEEETQEDGGVWDDLEHPDVYADSSPYTNVTILEHYDTLNQAAGRIKIIKPSAIQEFIKLFNKSIS